MVLDRNRGTRTSLPFTPRPDCRPRRKQASARLATHRPRSGGGLLELRRQPQAALPARANWTNIFGYRLDLMSKSLSKSALTLWACLVFVADNFVRFSKCRSAPSETLWWPPILATECGERSDVGR